MVSLLCITPTFLLPLLCIKNSFFPTYIINELINWKVCPVMSRANLDFQTPYSGLTYCNEGFIQVYLDMDERFNKNCYGRN